MSDKNLHHFGKVMEQMFENSGIGDKIYQAKFLKDWKEIAGEPIARNTNDLGYVNRKLYLHIDSGALKSELHILKDRIKDNINNFYKKSLVDEIIIR